MNRLRKHSVEFFCPIVQSPAKKTWQLLSNVHHCLQKVEKVKRKPCGGIFAPLSTDQLLLKYKNISRLVGCCIIGLSFYAKVSFAKGLPPTDVHNCFEDRLEISNYYSVFATTKIKIPFIHAVYTTTIVDKFDNAFDYEEADDDDDEEEEDDDDDGDEDSDGDDDVPG